jgi:cell division control protein 6
MTIFYIFVIYVFLSFQFKSGYKIMNINCTSMKSSGSIYARIAQELGLKVSKQTEKNYLASVQRYLVSYHKIM